MSDKDYGPELPISKEIHAQKHRLEGETFREQTARIAAALKDSDEHFHDFRYMLLRQAFMPGGRIQSSMGSPRQTTAFNCFVSMTIPDSMDGIMEAAKEAAQTMRLGGGIGYDFSTIRPSGDLIVSLDSSSSGPLSFMRIFDSICSTVSSAGHRRGAQMGVLRVDHPDIEAFVEAKTNRTEFTQFNLSVAVTDEFMQAVIDETSFDLVFNGRVYKRVDAKALWDQIMRATWHWAEPGILFIDTINRMNNLSYCETISSTNPCGEQPLPPHGACLLGSFNLAKYVHGDTFDWKTYSYDISTAVRAMDNVVDNTIYPLPEQEAAAKSKRRMGLGITGLANAGEALGYPYASEEFIAFTDEVMKTLANDAYMASSLLAKEKGSFPLYDEKGFLDSPFVQKLNADVIKSIRKNGMRNSHLISIAPTGTISLGADNVSGGIEPVFAHSYNRTIKEPNGSERVELVEDYGVRVFGVKGRTASELSPAEHLSVLATVTRWVDSAVSKTINVGDDVTFDEFESIYMDAWKLGCKGATTFRSAGERFGILNKVEEKKTEGACYISETTGQKECS